VPLWSGSIAGHPDERGEGRWVKRHLLSRRRGRCSRPSGGEPPRDRGSLRRIVPPGRRSDGPGPPRSRSPAGSSRRRGFRPWSPERHGRCPPRPSPRDRPRRFAARGAEPRTTTRRGSATGAGGRYVPCPRRCQGSPARFGSRWPATSRSRPPGSRPGSASPRPRLPSRSAGRPGHRGFLNPPVGDPVTHLDPMAADTRLTPSSKAERGRGWERYPDAQVFGARVNRPVPPVVYPVRPPALPPPMAAGGDR